MRTGLRKCTRRSFFSLLEVVIAILIFAASIGALLSILGSARARILRAERRWARAHLLTSAVEFHLLAGDTAALPDGVLPEGFRAECAIEEVSDLPEEAEQEIRGWRLAEYGISVIDPAGERVAYKRIRQIIAEQWRKEGSTTMRMCGDSCVVKCRRFTLLEMTIAILLLAGLTAIVFLCSSSIAASWERMNAEKERFAELLVLDRALDSLLSNAVPFQWKSELEEGRERPVFSGRREELGFVSLGQVHSYDNGGLTFVHLRVDDDTLFAYYQSRPLIPPEDPRAALRQSALAEGVERIECSYADVTEDGIVEWVDEWDTAEERVEIPLAIWLRVYWQDGREESWLRRTAGSGQYERYGKWRPAPTI